MLVTIVQRTGFTEYPIILQERGDWDERAKFASFFATVNIALVRACQGQRDFFEWQIEVCGVSKIWKSGATHENPIPKISLLGFLEEHYKHLFDLRCKTE